MSGIIDYSLRDFASLKQAQISYIQQYYPGVIQNYNDASILSVFLDLNAAIADNLQYNIDTSLQETVLDYAQQTQSLYNIAKTYGLKLPGMSASVSIVSLSVQVPVRGSDEDKRYSPYLYAGSQFTANNNTFELLYDVDFSSTFNTAGNIDRTKIPIYVNGTLSAYQITKTGIVIAGTTKVYTQVITNTQPFYQITLPENNVLSIDAIIHKNGTTFQTIPTNAEFNSSNNQWYEVPALIENQVFIEDTTQTPVNGVYPGKYLTVDQRYIKEFTPTGFCVITFGSQINQGVDILDTFAASNIFDLKSFINNDSLGWAPINNTTMYIKYRIGGGSSTNIGVGTINTVGTISMNINGPDSTVNATVQNSLTVTNVIPAVGGSDVPNIEYLRNYIGYNFASQNRAVTLNDYSSILLGMPAKYGVPAMVGVTQENNKININILSTDTNGNLSEQVSTAILQNVSTYLSRYRMINDYVIVQPAQVIDIGFEIAVVVNSGSQISVTSNIATIIQNEFAATNQSLGSSYLIGNLSKLITQIDGVLNINYINVYNKVGGEYSTSSIDSSLILDPTTNQIDVSSGAIIIGSNQVLQVLDPANDITVIPITLSTSFGQ